MTTDTNSPIIVLVAGHWLGAWAWDDVLEHLETDRARAVAVTLPGLDGAAPARSPRTLAAPAEALDDLLTRLDVSEEQPATLVAHSGANAPVSMALDRHPELMHRVVWVDSGPMANGSAFAPGFPEEELPLPPFEVLAQQTSLDGLSTDVLERFRSRAVPEPGPVLRQPVELANDARTAVPTTLVCCSIPSSQVLDMAREGHPLFAEVANLETLDVVDLPTGHWPMWSRARDLAEVIRSAASRTS